MNKKIALAFLPLIVAIALVFTSIGLSINQLESGIDRLQYDVSMKQLEIQSLQVQIDKLSDIVQGNSDKLQGYMFQAEVTAYCSCEKCTGKISSDPAYNLTSRGGQAQKGRTIAMDKSVPFGTKVLIDGFGDTIFTVEDRGGAITGNKIDIYMRSHEEALAFGRKMLNVYVLR